MALVLWMVILGSDMMVVESRGIRAWLCLTSVAGGILGMGFLLTFLVVAAGGGGGGGGGCFFFVLLCPRIFSLDDDPCLIAGAFPRCDCCLGGAP